MDKKIKVLIDTDIGDEIDDALAIYLAAHLGYEIVGITTVFRNTAERARLAKKLLSEIGGRYENVPVYAGWGAPIGTDCCEWEHTCHYTPELDSDEYRPDGDDPDKAVDFIIDCCKKWGDELTVISIGPFTNVAKAIQKDAKALRGARNVVIMGGAFYKQYADWNVICDVAAADEMFRSLDNLICLGADVTHTLDIGEENYSKLLECEGRGGALTYLAKLTKLWRAENPSRCPTLHDPLAIYYPIDRAICGTEQIAVKVITDGYAKGITLNVDSYSKAYMNDSYKATVLPRATVAKTVESQRFIDEFMRYFQ